MQIRQHGVRSGLCAETIRNPLWIFVVCFYFMFLFHLATNSPFVVCCFPLALPLGRLFCRSSAATSSNPLVLQGEPRFQRGGVNSQKNGPIDCTGWVAVTYCTQQRFVGCRGCILWGSKTGMNRHHNWYTYILDGFAPNHSIRNVLGPSKWVVFNTQLLHNFAHVRLRF